MPVVHVDDLKRLVHGGDEEEPLTLLRSYEAPEEYAGEARRRRGLPEDEWLIDAMCRILPR